MALAHLDTFAFNLLFCDGTGPWRQYDRQSSLVLCYDGQVLLDSDLGQVSLHRGELATVPKSTAYRLSGEDRALVLELQRHKAPGLPIPD